MTIDQLSAHEVISLDQLDQLDQLAADVVVADVRVADAAVPDPPPGSGTAAVLPAPRPTDACSASWDAASRPVPWPRSRRWAEARVVPLGPAAVATAWLSALARADWTTAWSTTDPNLRLALAQQWLDGLGRTGDNVTAWSLAAEIPHVGMWAPFAEQLFPRLTADRCPNPRTGDGLRVQGPSDHHQFGRIGRLARPDVGRELCVVETTAGGTDRRQPLTLRLRDRWRIAGLGAGVLQPGWPARWIDLDRDPGLDRDNDNDRDLGPGPEPAGNLHPNGEPS